MKKPIEKWTGTVRPDGSVIYQRKSSFNGYGKTYDEHDFDTYCESKNLRREFEKLGGGLYEIYLYPIETRQIVLF